MHLTDVALLTDHRYTAASAAEGDWYLSNILHDDRLLREALTQRGLTSLRVDWADASVDWSSFRCAVFRTTWDYFHRFSEFSAWLDRVSQQTLLLNDLNTVRWNMDKHYLADLAERGLPVVPSAFLERGSSKTIHEVLEEKDWDEAVIKPCVSGGARHTYRVNRLTAAAIQSKVNTLLTEEAMLVQPFQEDILHTGEDTLMLFAGRYSHAVRKRAKCGDFRVQDDHGGTVHPLQPSAEQIELAERTFAQLTPTPIYGRVDMVRDHEGHLAIMELELIEPEMWLRTHPPAAERFAQGIADRLISSKS